MSQEPTAFELCLPGIVAGLMLATVVLATGEAGLSSCFPGNVSTRKHSRPCPWRSASPAVSGS